MRRMSVLLASTILSGGALADPLSQYPDLPLPPLSTDRVPVIRQVPVSSAQPTGWKNYKISPAGISQVGVTGLPSVTTNAGLAATPSTFAPQVVRAGFYAAGDSQAIVYTSSATPCSLNSGAGDGGSQIPTSDNGCWNWIPPVPAVTPLVFGAHGNGINTDTVPVQNSANAAGSAGIIDFFDGVHLYAITTLNLTVPVDIEGAYRFGFWTTYPTNSGRACPWGIVSENNVTIINATAVTGTIRNLCVQAGPNTGSGVSATAGAAIQLAPSSTTTYQTGWNLEGNTLINVYDGITVNGAGYSSGCCGEGTTSNGVTILRNTITNPADVGLSIGKNTAGAETVGITAIDNAIGCINATSKASGIGVALYDGALWYDGTQNGPEGCNIGTAIIPGSVSGHVQEAQIDAKGVLGDQSATHDLLIQPSNSSGYISFGSFDNAWAGGTSATDNEVLISVANGGTITNVAFNGGTYHSATNQTVPVFDVEGGSGGGIVNLTLNTPDITCWNTTTSCLSGLKLNSVSSGDIQHVTIFPKISHTHAGTFATGAVINTNPGGYDITVSGGAIAATTGISLATPSSGNSSNVTITGVGLSVTTTPISYTPNLIDEVTIANNLGVDSACPVVTVTSNSITLPNANNCEQISTTGTPNVTNLGPPWQGRQVVLQSFAAGGFTTSYDGTKTYPICRSTTVAQSQTLTLTWHAGATCWSTSL